jgi:hypothetical protein
MNLTRLLCLNHDFQNFGITEIFNPGNPLILCIMVQDNFLMGLKCA